MIIHYLCTTLFFVFINMQRIVLFDIAKALCIVLVVVGHYFPDNSPVWYECLNKLIYSFHIPLFMFASGFIYMATKKEGESYSKFLVKKLKRLMLPYVVVSVIVISIKMLTEKHAFVENPVTAYAYIKMLYFPEAGYFLWFIWALWWMFVIAPLFATKQKRLLLLGAALLLYCIPPFLPEVFCFKQFQSMLVFFMLGAVCCDWSKIATSVRIPFWAVCLSFAALEYFYRMSFSHPFCRDCNNNLFVRHHFKRSKKNQWFADNIGDKLYNLFVPHHIRGRCKGCLTKIRAHSA